MNRNSKRICSAVQRSAVQCSAVQCSTPGELPMAGAAVRDQDVTRKSHGLSQDGIYQNYRICSAGDFLSIDSEAEKVNTSCKTMVSILS